MTKRLFFNLVLWSATAALAGTSLLVPASDAYNAGDFERAARLFREAAGKGENPAICCYNAANAYFQMDSLAEAVVYYRACLQDAPDFLKANLNLAVCYYRLDDLPRCLGSVRRTLELDPLHQKALLIQAATLRRVGAIAQSIAAFEKIVRFYSQTEEAYVALGEMYRDLGDEDEAIRWLEMSPSRGKNTVYVYTLLSDLYEKKGDVAGAISYLSSAFDRDTTKQWVLYHIAQLQRQSGNPLVALEVCRDGLKRFPKFADMALLAGSIAFERDHIVEAEAFFAAAARNGSSAAVVGLENVRGWRKAHERLE
jgi:tetratricopeptide (TPR) repeat protein